MDGLRPAARLYLLGLAVAAVAVALVALRGVAFPGWERAALAVALAGAVTLTGAFQLPFADRTKLSLGLAVLAAAVLLLEPGIALVVAGGGMLAAQVLRREPWDQTVFNAAQLALLAAAGGGALAAAGWRFDEPDFDRPGPLLLAAAVGGGLWLLNNAAVGTMVALQEGTSPRRAWARLLFGGGRAEALTQLAQIGFGVVVAGLVVAQGWWVALLLLPAGAGYQSLAHHVRARRDAEARLVHQAYHDPLTDLPNRALLLDRLDQALARAGRRDEPIALLFLDLDRFKVVNDRLGHAAGDRLLAAIAERLRDCVRPGDTVARLGGDEFVVLLDGLADTGEAEAVAGRIAAALEVPVGVDGHEVAVTSSIGVAVAEPGTACSADLLRDADVAMYRAKEQGRARLAVFDPAMGAGVRRRAALEGDLRRAIGAGELRLVYQPIVDLGTGRVIGVEALARWAHPERGTIAPDAFVPLAEESGLIEPLGRWALDEACRQGRRWQERGAAPVVSVNVSARQFQGPGLVEAVAVVLRETGLAPDRLQLEITEGAAMDDADAAVATLRQLKGLGVRLAIDDFGTGYSSLAYLQRFPVDLLKVDRRFVAGLGRNEGDTAIVQAVVGLAHTLGLGVVAEGVETGEQAQRLRELGCALAQGFHFGPAVSPEAIAPLLDNVTYAMAPRQHPA